MKRLVVAAIAATGAVVVRQRLKAQQAEQELWAQITDSPDTDGDPQHGAVSS